MAKDNFFNRLTRLFRSGPALQRRIKGQDYKASYDKALSNSNLGFRGHAGFGKESSPFSALGAYGILDRMARYSTFSTMEQTAEISTCLDIFADEICASDDKGRCLSVYSENPEIKSAIQELFLDILNVDFNLRPWSRNMSKYGDFFLFVEVVPDVGVISCTPIPVNELERDEGFDPQDPLAVRFKWLTRGNKILENWQVIHIRILGNDMMLPYGTSVLDGARRVHSQLTLMEDAMLTYRVVRSPERRVFYIDIGNTAPNDVQSFMEATKAALRSNTLVDRQNGRSDQRYNPISIEEDYFIPIRGETGGTKIETLAGGQHVSATEDVEYLQKKLFAALKVPRAYFGYDEGVGSKATLASEDVKFSRTISILQKIIIAEFNKLAILHLYAKGFDGEDLVNFELFLTNPSSIAVQQKLALWNDKMDIATKAKELGLVGEGWIQEEILGFTPEDISKTKNARKEDVLFAKELEAIAVSDENQERQATVDPFDPSNYQVPGSDVEKNQVSGGQSGVTDAELVKGISRFDQDGQIMRSETAPGVSPVKATPYATRMRRNDKRQVGQGGIGNLGMPNFKKMLDFSGKHQYNTDIYDGDFVNRRNEQVEMEKSLRKSVEVPRSIRKMLDEMDRSIGKSKAKMLTEAFEKQEKEKDTSDKLSLLLEEAFPENAGLLNESNIPEKDLIEGEEDLETSEIIKDLEKDD